MKNVSISYNPYKLTTHITVDGNELKENSKLRERSAEGNRLQEWVEDLPDMLLNEFNDKKFAVSFHGTIMDYEDLKEVLDEAQEQNKFLSIYFADNVRGFAVISQSMVVVGFIAQIPLGIAQIITVVGLYAGQGAAFGHGTVLVFVHIIRVLSAAGIQ